VEEATITILPFGALDADLRPALLGGRFGAATALHLANTGNRPEAVTISGSDRAERLDFRIDRPILTLQPGETVNVRLRLSGGDVKLVGGADTRPFTLDVRAASYDTPPLSLSGTYERRALIPTGLPVAGATLAALAMGGFAIYSAFLAPKDAPSAANTTTIGASPTVAVQQSAAPPPPTQAPATPPPTASPAPTPTPTPTASPTPSPTPTAAPTSVGGWKNVNPNANGIVKIDIAAVPGGITVRPWGACSPTPCDWGIKMVTVPPTATTFDVHWSSSFAERDQHYEMHPDGTLAVSTHTHFTDSSGRADYDMSDQFSR
jgi:hypothetical protein